MKLYTAKVVDDEGHKRVITEEAISRPLFEESIYNRGLFVIDIKETGEKKSLFFADNLSKKFLLDFSYNIYSLLEFGIDINEVFKILSEIYTKGKEVELVNEIISYLKKGEKLSSALKNSTGGEIFDDFFITMVSSGEHSGKLTESFKLINQYLKNNQKIKDELISASVYPITLLITAILAVNLLFFFILPNFQKIYENMNFTPQLLINLMFKMSDILVENALIYLIVLLLSIIGILIFFRTNVSKTFISLLLHKLPIISKVARLQTKIKVSFSLEILLKGGASLEDALIKLEEIEQNPIFKKEYQRGLEILKEGGGVRESFKNLKIYNTRDLNIIEIADSISKSSEGFEKIHNDAENNLDTFLDAIFKMIEPVMMIFIAIFIFFIMYLVISPTINLMENF